MICKTCNAVIPDTALHCLVCLKRLSHQEMLKRQPQFLRKRLNLTIAKPAAPSRLHIEMFNAPQNSFCGADMNPPIRRERWYGGYEVAKLPVGLCPQCLDVLRQLLAEG